MADRKKRARKSGKGEPTDGDAHDESLDSEDESDSDEDEDPEVLVAEVVDDDDGASAEEADAELAKLLAPEKDEKKRKSVVKHDPLTAYVQETRRFPLLSREEEHELAVRFVENEDTAAARKLIESNLRLVVKIAYEYRRAHRNLLDLVQEGNIGLMQAVKRYDPYRGVKLSSYAAWWIRAYMLRYILNNHRMVKIGTTQAQRKLFFNLAKEKARLASMGIEPTHDEIAKQLNVDKKDVVEMDRRLARGDASLDAPVNEANGRTATRVDLLPSGSESPEGATEGAELSLLVRERLEEFRETLSGKDIAIFDKRLVAEEPMTLQQLGDEFGVSRERVRQLESRLRGKLGAFLKSTLGDAVEVH